MTLVLATLGATLTAFGCAPEPEPAAAVSNRVKVFTVGKQSTGQSRRISGRVEAASETTISFGVSGQVTEVLGKAGQTVVLGQRLAALDGEPFQLKLEEARAELNNARAKLVEAETTFERTKTLVEGRAASQKELDAAVAALSTANGNLKAARGAADRAALDVERTRLDAPFAGMIVDVHLDPFQEIAASGEAFTIQAAGALEVELLVPETLIRDVDFGQVVQVTFPTLPDVSLAGTVTEIGANAESGNAFPVTVTIAESNTDLRPGMTASVTFNFSAYLDGQVAYLIPLSALAIEAALNMEPSEDAAEPKSQAPLFVYDPAAGTLQFRVVRVGDLRGNEIEVFDGLEEGDQVVSAGVAFLRDGMSVEPWTPRQ